jgi:peptidoglycan hydrolase CwlO-like protein
MDNSAGNSPLTKWVDEMQGVIKTVTSLIEDSDRNRTLVESAQREQAELREEIHRLQAEVETQRMEVDRQRGETERQRSLLDATQRERDDLRTENAALNAETDRLRNEQTEAGETAAKLLGEMKDLVNQVAHKFQGPSKTSPFAREPRSPQP